MALRREMFNFFWSLCEQIAGVVVELNVNSILFDMIMLRMR